jgi:hypothetical protein
MFNPGFILALYVPYSSIHGRFNTIFMICFNFVIEPFNEHKEDSYITI